MTRAAWIVILCFSFAVGTFAGEITIGSFNIEWFGDGNKVRTDEQIQLLADYIRSLEVDILACQEINPKGDKSGNGVADWDDLLRELGNGFNGWCGATGIRQRLAFIWRPDHVQVTDLGELRGIEREPAPGTTKKTFPRIPITAYIKSLDGGVDFRVVAAHLYWSDDNARYSEAERLNEWLAEYLVGGYDRDVVLIGDCNTKPMGDGESHTSVTINNLELNSLFTCISKGHDEFTTPTSKERYDHAFLSRDFLNEYVDGSWDVRRDLVGVYPDVYMRDISNHVPVTLRILDEDFDDLPPGEWGI